MRRHKNTRVSGTAMLVLLLLLSLVPQSSYGQKRLKIISYNVLDGMSRDTTSDKSEFSRWLKLQHPDIVGFQELNGFTQQNLESFAQQYGHPYAILMKYGKYKVGLSSKFPVVNVQVVTDNMTHGFILAQIKDYHIVVAHLAPNDYRKRRTEIRLILSTIQANSKGPEDKWILMGDLNSLSPLDKSFYASDDRKRLKNIHAKKTHPANHRLIHGIEIDYMVQQYILNGGFIDAFHELKNNRLKSSETTGRVDYIYVSPNLQHHILAANFIRNKFTASHSDHKPMCLILEE